MIIGYRLLVYGKPGPIIISYEITVIIKFKHIIETKINITVSVIVKNTQVTFLYKIPLILRKLDHIFTITVLFPYKAACIKVILADIFRSFPVIKSPSVIA